MTTLSELKHSVWRDRTIVDAAAAAEILGISVSTISKMTRSGEIRARPIGTKHFYLVKDLMRKLEERDGSNPPSTGKD